MLVCYVEYKKPTGRKWTHVFTFTSDNYDSAINTVRECKRNTLRYKGNDFNYKLTVVGNNDKREIIFK